MKCDKCGKKHTKGWVPDTHYPKYVITEQTGLGDYAPVNLCIDCSRKFADWLNMPEEELK